MAVAQDWPQWRGPSRDGQFSGEPWPTTLSALKQKWRVELGPSYSGPIVIGNRIITTESRDKTHEVVRAFDRSSGEELWKAEWEGHQSVPFFAASNGDWMRSTPASDGKSIFVGGMRDMLVCLAADTGQIRWYLDFVKECNASPPTFGFVCSPLLDREFLYVQAGAGLCKVQKSSGKIVWRTLDDGGGMNGSAFSSPVLATLAGRRQLVVQTRDNLCGVDPEDGKVLWQEKIPSFRGMNILTPVIKADRIFTSSYGGRTLVFHASKSDSGPKVELDWEDKTEGYMSTPVVIAGKVFLHQKNQRMSCFDLATGERHWLTDEKFGKYVGFVAQKDRILALDERGLLLLIQANPAKFQLLEQRKISEQDTWAHLAVSGRQVVVRELKALTCWSWE